MPAKPQLKRWTIRSNAASTASPGRTLKMAQPVCSICKSDNPPINWWMFCEHEPYVDVSEVPVREPVVEDDPDVPGQRIITGERTKLVYLESPNFGQVSVGTRFDSGHSVKIARECGFKTLEELGWAPACEYRDCWRQDIKVSHPIYGNYCSEIHARTAIANEQGILLEALDEGRRQEQLSKIVI